MDQQNENYSVRLNGKIIIEYVRTKEIEQSSSPKDQKKQQGWLPILFNRDSDVEQKERELEQKKDYKKRCIIAEIIDHSRKLSLQQYEKELNYTIVKGKEYFYRAKHKLLFVLEIEGDQMSTEAIESILEQTIALYEVRCQLFCNGYKLPTYITQSQMKELQKLSDQVNNIIQKQDEFQFVRKQSIRQATNQQSIHLIHTTQQRTQKITQILDKQLKMNNEQIRFRHEIQKKLNRQRVKICLLCLIAGIVAVFTLYFICRDDFNSEM